jgi:hypothetical protein
MKAERIFSTHKPGSITGAVLLICPILLQIPYVMLAQSFDYPDILRRPADLILRQYEQGGGQLTLVWLLFAMSILPLLAAIVMLPTVMMSGRHRWLQAATPLGVASAVLQMLGLLRWVVVVPVLADLYMDPASSTAQREAALVAFRVQHQLFGVLMGEYLGQTLLALWTLGVTLALDYPRRLARLVRWLGVAAAVLFLVGAMESLSSVLPGLAVLGPLPGIAFLVWSSWCLLLGWIVIWPGKLPSAELLRSEACPAAEVAM